MVFCCMGETFCKLRITKKENCQSGTYKRSIMKITNN